MLFLRNFIFLELFFESSCILMKQITSIDSIDLWELFQHKTGKKNDGKNGKKSKFAQKELSVFFSILQIGNF